MSPALQTMPFNPAIKSRRAGAAHKNVEYGISTPPHLSRKIRAKYFAETMRSNFFN